MQHHSQSAALLERYSASEPQAAIEEILASGAAPHSNPVHLTLERQREARKLPPPVAISMPEHVRKKATLVTPHRLDIYDQLTAGTDERA